MDRYPPARHLADLKSPLDDVAPEYLGSISTEWQSDPSSGGSRQRIVAPLAVMALVVAIIGTCVAVVGHHKNKPVTNADLLRLIHSASDAFSKTPSNDFTMTTTVTYRGHSSRIDMAGVSSAPNHESTFTMTANGIKEWAIEVGGVTYLKLPYLNAALHSGKDWLAVPSPKPNAVQRQLQASGPAGLLNGLATVKGTVENEGTEDVQNVETTKYRFRLNAMKLFGSTFTQLLGPNANSILKREGFQNLPMTLWLDKQGLPRQVEIDLHFAGITMNEVGYMTPSEAPLNLSAPPASNVRMLRSLSAFGQLLQDVRASSGCGCST